MARGRGFEPRLIGSKPTVLPVERAPQRRKQGESNTMPMRHTPVSSRARRRRRFSFQRRKVEVSIPTPRRGAHCFRGRLGSPADSRFQRFSKKTRVEGGGLDPHTRRVRTAFKAGSAPRPIHASNSDADSRWGLFVVTGRRWRSRSSNGLRRSRCVPNRPGAPAGSPSKRERRPARPSLGEGRARCF